MINLFTSCHAIASCRLSRGQLERTGLLLILALASVVLKPVAAAGELNCAAQYWATEPYKWDTGITVWQQTSSGLTSIFTVCTGCSG